MAKEPKPHIVDITIEEALGKDEKKQPWPLDFMDQKGIPPRVEFKFYNLGTRYNEGEDAWDDLDDVFETTKKTLGTLQYTFDTGRLNIYKHYGFEARQHTQDYTFISNDYEIDLETIQAEFGPDNEDQFERRPLLLPNYISRASVESFPYGEGKYFLWYGNVPEDYDKLESQQYYFMGDGCHDFRVELIKDKDDIEGSTRFDISRELYLAEETEGKGNVKDGVENEEGNVDPLLYQWRNVKPGRYYLRVREVGNASVCHYVKINKEWQSRWQIYEDITQQGLFFYGFDTSDTGEETSQFRITTECDPDGAEIDGRIIKSLTRPLVELYLMPRRIALWARESGLDTAPTEFELAIGDGTRKVYAEKEEFFPTEEANPCLHAVISSTEGEEIFGDVEFEYDGVTLTGSMSCQYGSYCFGDYWYVGGGIWGCFGTTVNCSGEIETYPIDYDTQENLSACIAFVDQCEDDVDINNIVINYQVKHEDATRRTHKHTIGLWYSQMPNKGFIYQEYKSPKTIATQSVREDLERVPAVYTRNEYFNLNIGSGYYPHYVGYESEHDQYTILNEFEPYCESYDLLGLNLVYDYLWTAGSGVMFYLMPEIYHFHNPWEYQTKNFIADAGGTQEEQDDIVNPIRTLHFFTCDQDYGNHSIYKGYWRKWEYSYLPCEDWYWATYCVFDAPPRMAWWSAFNFLYPYTAGISCDFLTEYQGPDSFTYEPHENELGREIFRKIQNSNVWSSYYDKVFGYEGRTYESKPYGFGIVPAKAGTLAAIIKIRSKVFYVWFKNDENYKIWGRAKQLKDPEYRTDSVFDSVDEYELTEYMGYQIGFEDQNCDNLWYGPYDDAGLGDDPPEQWESLGPQKGQPTGFFNQCAGDGNRIVTHLGRTPVITWGTETNGNWADGDDITNGIYLPGENGPCRIPFYLAATSNNYKHGTMIAPNEGTFELDAPIVIVGSRDCPVRPNGKNSRVCWAMNFGQKELYFL